MSNRYVTDEVLNAALAAGQTEYQRRYQLVEPTDPPHTLTALSGAAAITPERTTMTDRDYLLAAEDAICEACGKPVRLINLDKAMGRVGKIMGWVHVSGLARHRPVVTEADS